MKPAPVARNGSLGLVLLAGFLIEVVALTAYGWLAFHAGFTNEEPPAFDEEVKEAFHEHGKEHPAVVAVLKTVTQLGSTVFISGLALALFAIIWIKEQRLLALVCFLGIAGGGGGLNPTLKILFQRSRPAFDPGDGPFVQEMGYSFTSGHSMGSLVAYSLVGYLLFLVLPKWWQRLAAALGLVLLVLTIGFSRMYLGAHYFTDVVGGYALGAAWVTPFIVAIEIARRRRQGHSSVLRNNVE